MIGALEFLREAGLGRPVKVGRQVLVIGGGNTASDAARSAIRLGGGEAIIASLESAGELLIVPEDLEQARDEGVAFAPNTSLVKVLSADGQVTGAVVCDARLGKDAQGGVRPELVPGTEREITCDTILIAIGQVQQLEWLPDHLSDRGVITADQHGRVEGNVFVGGDVMRGPSMVVDALGDGKRAARDIDRVLTAQALEPEPEPEVMPYEGLNAAYFRHAPRIEAPLTPAGERRRSQKVEVTLAYSSEQAVAESDRCMSCGVCNGCDNCYIVCPDVSVMRDTRENGALHDPHHLLQGVPRLRAGVPDRLPGEGPGNGLRRPGRRHPDGDGLRTLRRGTRRAVGVHPPADRGNHRRVRRCPRRARRERQEPRHSQTETRGDAMTTIHVDGAWAGEPNYGPGSRTPDGEQMLAGLAGTRKRLNGCAAAAYAALYANVDVITAYPIRPYTAIMMNLSQFVADGILDAEYIVADGEHAQLSAAFGAGSCGARAFTGSSGVGVTYAYEMYSIISGARIPIQMSIADRTLDPPGDFGSEHTDALCTRDMGWLMGWAATPQEVFDKTLIAYAIGEDPRVLLPQMVVQDGYFVSHIAGEVEMPVAGQVDAYLPPYRLPFPLDPRRPVSHGPQIHPSQGPPLQLERARAMEDAIPVIREKTDEFAVAFGRHYPHFVEEYMLDDADVAIVISGGHSVTCRAAIRLLRERGVKIGMARLLWIRPFPSEDLRAALRGVKAVGVVETNLGLGGSTYGGILAPDVTGALYYAENRPLVTSFMAGLGGETVPAAEFEWMAGKLTQALEQGRVEKPAHWVGFEAPLAQGDDPLEPPR